MCDCGNCLNPFVIPNGADGLPGSQGIQGFTGPTGPAGTNGTDGSEWLSGSGVPGAGIGDDGDFYLDTATGDVYTKTAGIWNAPILNISGTVGAAGADGDDGLSFRTGTGVPLVGVGIDGDSYIDLGSAGVDLYVKSGGIWVDTGIDLKGATGANGTDGFNFLQGVGVPASGLGNDGDSYLDSDTGNLYIKQTGSWTLTGNLLAGGLMEQYTFKANKTATQALLAASISASYYPAIIFQDTDTSPYFDNGNDMHQDKYVTPNSGLTQKFIVEGLNFTTTSVSGGSPSVYEVSILREGPGGTLIPGALNATSFTIPASVSAGYAASVPSTITDYIVLAAGEFVAIHLRLVSGSGVDFDVDANAKFSNSFE